MKTLIVGGGLAGISIAHCLENQQMDFSILDKGVNHSTGIAGGMINPLSFRRMVKSWKADTLFPKLLPFYHAIEKKTNSQFIHSHFIRRVFSSQEERTVWEERSQDSDYKHYIQAIEKENPTHVVQNLGSGIVNTLGFIDAHLFLEANQQYFKEKNKLKVESLDFSEFLPEELQYKGRKYKRIIFAEGFEAVYNPFFSYLPFKNAKGEILTISSPDISEQEILNRKCFLLPMGNQQFKLGATYAWNTKDVSPTKKAKEELIEKLKALTTAKFKIINQQAGIRPVAADRHPLIGEHPKRKGIYIFNGLGAKGFMTAPFYADQFVKFLQGKAALDDEVDIQRYYRRHFLK